MLKDYYNTPESVYTVVEGQKMHQTDKLFMDTVVDTIQEHIESENLRMELIAERLGLTARNFYRKFKKISGRTPSEFIKEYRFEYAARLLTTTHLTIQERSCTAWGFRTSPISTANSRRNTGSNPRNTVRNSSLHRGAKSILIRIKKRW